MMRRLAVLLAPLPLLLAVTAAPAAAARSTAPPSSMAALGDSITRGFNACGWFVECTSRSWSAGDNTGVNTHFLRIKAKNPGISGHVYNDSVSGADSADLLAQAKSAVGQKVEYVTILMGANDACGSSESVMTSVGTFRSRVDGALATIRSGLPGARILLVSIPDLKRLWSIGKGSALATTRWSMFNVCQSILANATSTAAADAARRDRVRQRVIDYNAQLVAACTAYGANCRHDQNALFNYPFVLGQISAWDYFHPNDKGQAVLANITYTSGYNW